MTAALQPVSMKKGRQFLPRLSPKREPGRTSERFWTAEEDAVVRAVYPVSGAAAVLQKLPNRTIRTIYNAAHRLGLRAPRIPATRKRHVCTPELETKIRERWPTLTKRGSIQVFADELGEPKWWVLKQAARLGLLRLQRKEPPWSKAEVELLTKVPLHSPDMAARIFHDHGFRRTPTAIIIRSKRLGMSRRFRETLSARAAAAILGIDDKSITRCCINGSLRATKRATQRLPQQGGDAWSITRADLRQYVLDNVEALDIRKVDKIAFIDLLVNAGSKVADQAVAD